MVKTLCTHNTKTILCEARHRTVWKRKRSKNSVCSTQQVCRDICSFYILAHCRQRKCYSWSTLTKRNSPSPWKICFSLDPFGPKRVPLYFQKVMSTAVLVWLIYTISLRYKQNVVILWWNRIRILWERFSFISFEMMSHIWYS